MFLRETCPLQIASRNSWKNRGLGSLLGCLVIASTTTKVQAQTYYYYPTSNTPVYYYWPTGAQVQTAWPGYFNQYYQSTYITPNSQTATAPQYYQPTATDTSVQSATYSQPVGAANTVPVTQASYTAAPAATTAGATQAAQPPVVAGDPYGFTSWLNATRAAYGLTAVGYDPNLSSWAAMNNDHQASRGIGHFVMGPARRQNSAMGGYPGIESMWMASPAHRAALLDPTIRWIGIAGLGAYWTFNAN